MDVQIFVVLLNEKVVGASLTYLNAVAILKKHGASATSPFASITGTELEITGEELG
jgi:hypothetical protein